MSIYDISGKSLVSGSLFIPLEHGDIATAPGTGYVANTLETAGVKFRSAFPVEVESGSAITVEVANDANSVSSITAIEYNAAFSMVRATSVQNGKVAIASTTHYLKFVVTFTSTGHDPQGLAVAGCLRMVKNPKIRSVCERFIFDMPESGVYGSADLMLPPNYTVSGDSVPLLVYIHGSNGFSSWDSEIGSLLSGSTYLPYIEYLRDEGFAILDVYGWSSKYLSIANTQNTTVEPNKSNTFAAPITYSSFLHGIEYALSRYNVDPENISMYCKSMGGELALTFAVKADIKLRAVCCLAPTVDVLFWGSWGQSVAGRTILAAEFGLSGNVESVFEQRNFDWRSTNGKAFMDVNYEKLAGFNPGWNFDSITLADKYQDSYAYDFTNTSACRGILYPVKIWVAPDDTNISYPKILEYVAQAKNGGNDITLREMPSGTGAHHSVDTDPNAPKSSGTTALGIPYTDMPTAYVEMVEFIRSRA